MEKNFYFTKRRNAGIFAGAILASMVLAGSGAWATTHVVDFGGSLGLVFSPKTFSAAVGDTVRWVGDFSMHTTTSTSVPAGAATWNFGPTAATSFSYAIKVAGTYDYECAIHVAFGMVGSFTVNPSSVISNAPSTGAEPTAIVTGTPSGKSYIRFTVPAARRVSLSIMDLRGRTLATVVDRTLPAGAYREPLDGAAMARGIYFVNLQGLGGDREVFKFLN